MAIGVWGSNGQLVTPDEIDQRRQLAQSLMRQSQQPANYWTQGVANMMNAFLGGFENGRANKEQAGMDDKSAKFMQSLYPDSAQASPEQPIAQTQSPSVAQALVNTQAPDYGTTSASPVAHALGQNMAVDDFTNRLAQAESGGNPNAANPASSARGLYQITASTQAGIARNHPEANLPATGPMTPDQQKIAAILLDQDNRNALSAQGIQPTDANAYGAWFLGAPTATKVLSASDITPVSALTGDAAVRANPFLKTMTVGDFRNWTAGKIGVPTTEAAQSPPPAIQPQPIAQPSPLLSQDTQHSGPSLGQLMQGMMDPTLSPQAHSMAALIFQNRMRQDNQEREIRLKQADPLYRAQLDHYGAETAALQQRAAGGDAPPTEVRARMQYAAMAGLTPSDPRYQGYMLTGKLPDAPQQVAPNMLTPDQVKVAGLDPSKAWALDRNNVPQARGDSAQAVEQKKTDAQQATNVALDGLHAATNSALAILSAHPGAATGSLGHYAASWIPGGVAAQLRDQINTIKANGSYAALQGLKSTVGGLGAISDADMHLAAEKAGAINPDAPPDVVAKQLRDYDAVVSKMFGAGRSQSSDAPGGPSATQQQTGRTATNPKTGERMYEYAPDQWRPI